MEVVLIGLGGIGCALAPHLARYLEYREGPPARLTLVDGDAFTVANRSRQAFARIGNKARCWAESLSAEFERVSVRSREEYVTPVNAASLMQEGCIVLLAVDNHATRKLVSDRCSMLDDVCLISGGNELTDGNVQIHIRRGGQDLTQPLTAVHPEIAWPADRSPAERGCEVLQEQGAPQLLFTNLAVASAMLNGFYSCVELGRVEYDEVYLDVLAARMAPVRRSGGGM